MYVYFNIKCWELGLLSPFHRATNHEPTNHFPPAQSQFQFQSQSLEKPPAGWLFCNNKRWQNSCCCQANCADYVTESWYGLKKNMPLLRLLRLHLLHPRSAPISCSVCTTPPDDTTTPCKPHFLHPAFIIITCSVAFVVVVAVVVWFLASQALWF